LLLTVALVVLAAATAAAQAPASILLSRVAYNTRKNTAKPEGDLKATIRNAGPRDRGGLQDRPDERAAAPVCQGAVAAGRQRLVARAGRSAPAE